MDYNRVYASEILGIVLQNSSAAREAMVKHEGVDKLLRGVAAYRKRDPEDSEESEYVQNMFDSLCSLMLLSDHQLAFGKVQGLELMIRMIRERKFASSLALRLTDHSLRHCPANCHIFVEKLGLKVLFAMFMKPQQKSRNATRECEEHLVSIIQSLCRYSTGTPVARVLNKFTEFHFEKLERLLEMHEEYIKSVSETDASRSSQSQLDKELDVDGEEQLFLDRYDAGLFTLQQLDIVLIRLGNMGNEQVAEEIAKLLGSKGVSFKEIGSVVQEYCSHLDVSAAEEKRELCSFVKSLAKRCNCDDFEGWEEAAPNLIESRAEDGAESSHDDRLDRDKKERKLKKEKEKEKDKKEGKRAREAA